MQKVYRRLKAWRLRRDLTQTEAAKLAGMPQSRWCLIEQGKVTPTLHQALGIQRASKGEFPADGWPEPQRKRAA